jgi:hypothetical protein
MLMTFVWPVDAICTTLAIPFITKGRRANAGELGICQKWYNIEGEAVMRKLSLIIIPLAILLLIILQLVFATGGGGA